MKLLFYNHTEKVSGAERVLLLILSQLKAQEFACHVLCPRGALMQAVENKGVPCQEVEPLEARFTWRPDQLWRYLRSFLHVVACVRTHVKMLAPDLIHANSIRAGLVMTAATMGMRVPVIWHLHDMLPHHPISTAIRCFALCFSRLRFLAVSEATAARFRGTLLRMFPRRISIRVILNCVDTDVFQPNDTQRQTSRAELGLTETQFAIGMIGQITPRKNQQGLLQAFAQIAPRLPQARLLIAGEPMFTEADQQYHQHLLQTADALGITGQVLWLGARRDVPELMQALDLLVVNSLAEPCGLVVLEGLASGLSIIVTAVGGNVELVHHGINGWTVPVNENQKLAAAIQTLEQLPTLREQLSHNARLSAVQRFTVKMFMKSLRAFYLDSGMPSPVRSPEIRAKLPRQQPSSEP
ncbi:MAG TPA: glycosyltransferase family 4 protein [Blastocatellia bacterium]|nr:glycosyltransferase family 4 protein [Blastocatellia bacterium]